MTTMTRPDKETALASWRSLGVRPVPYLRPGRILLIEDDESLCRGLARRFAKTSYELIPCTNGADGFAKIVLESPDIVLLDLGLPGMHGFKILNELRALPCTRGLPVVLVTGNEDPALDEKAAAWGVCATLHKPFDTDRLIGIVDEILYGLC